MKKILKKVFLCSLAVIMGSTMLYTSSAYAMEVSKYEANLDNVLEKVLKERDFNGEVSEESIKELENIIASVNVDSSTMSRSGKWKSLGKGWRFRIDPPHTGTDTGKYHVHVEGPGVKGSEGVDGTESHKTTMNKSKIPSSIQKKIKGTNEYKNGQKKQKKVKEAKAKIKSKKLNLRKHNDIIIAIGIFISIVGVATFATSAVSAWGALLLCI